MSIKWKLIAAIVGPLALAIGLVAWKAKNLGEKQRTQALEESSAQQLGPLRGLLEHSVDNLVERLAQILEIREAGATLTAGPPAAESVAKRRLFPFLAAGFYVRRPDGSWDLRWLARAEDKSIENWSDDDLRGAMARLPFNSAKEGESLWWSMADSEKRRHFVVLTPVDIRLGSGTNPTESRLPEAPTPPESSPGDTEKPEAELAPSAAESVEVVKGVVVGLIPRGFFNKATEVYKGTSSEVFLVDGQGYVLAHPVTQNWGVPLTEHELVAELLRMERSTGAKFYSSGGGQKSFGRFVSLPRSNLFLVWTAPVSSTDPNSADELAQILVIGIFVALLAVAVALLLNSSLVARIKDVQAALFKWAREGGGLNLQVKGSDEIAQLARIIQRLPMERDARLATGNADVERIREQVSREAYQKIGSGVSQLILKPMTAALGYLQLLKAKLKLAEGDEALSHLLQAEKETRRVRDLGEKLAKMVGSEVAEKQICDLAEILLAALAEERQVFAADEIRIIKDFSQTGVEVIGNRHQLQLALVNVLEFARLRLGESKLRELRVKLEKNGEKVQITLVDSAVGLTPLDVLQVFDPFSANVIGASSLNMAFAQSILQEHLGNIEIRSPLGQGNQVIIEMPLSKAVKSLSPGWGGTPDVKASVAVVEGSPPLGDEAGVATSPLELIAVDEVTPAIEIPQVAQVPHAELSIREELSPKEEIRPQQEDAVPTVAGEVAAEAARPLPVTGAVPDRRLDSGLPAPLQESTDLHFPSLPNERTARAVESGVKEDAGDTEHPTPAPIPASAPSVDPTLDWRREARPGEKRGDVIDRLISKMMQASEQVKNDLNDDHQEGSPLDLESTEGLHFSSRSPAETRGEEKRQNSDAEDRTEPNRGSPDKPFSAKGEPLTNPLRPAAPRNFQLDVLKVVLDEVAGLSPRLEEAKRSPASEVAFPSAPPDGLNEELAPILGDVDFPGFTRPTLEHEKPTHGANGEQDEDDDQDEMQIRRPKIKREE